MTFINKLTSGFLFDLDGTLLDSAPEYVAALNLLLREDGLRPIGFSVARDFVSRGAFSLLRLGYGQDLTDDLYATLRPRFLTAYERTIADSELFAGIADVLNGLDEQNIPWGIVTNKPGFLTEQVLPTVLQPWTVQSVVSGDSLDVAKPHPAPVLHACRELAIDPQSSVFVGDAEVDVAAGRAAGMQTAIAGWGYFSAAQTIERWGADRIVEAPAQISTLL